MPTLVSPVYAVFMENVEILRERELHRLEALRERNVQLRAQVEGLRVIVQDIEDRRTRRQRRRFGLRGGVYRVYFEDDNAP